MEANTRPASRMDFMPRGPSAVTGRHFAREMRTIRLESHRSTYRQVARQLRLLQRRYEGKLARNRYLRLEIRRRIGEAFVNEAILHKCPYSTCRAAFSKLFVLGFSTNELKWHYCLLYARVALEHGHRRIAYRIADSMYNELSKWLKFHRSSAGKELLDLIRVLMQKSSRV